jgi:seryl-tRNA synthetase
VIDLRLLRADPERVRASQRIRGEDPALVDDLLAADERRRSAVSAADALRAEQKTISKQVPKASGEQREELLRRAKGLADDVRAAEAALATADQAVHTAHRAIPNVVADGVPAGGEDDAVVLERIGTVPDYPEPVRDHVEMGELLRAIDIERGAKVSGARFYFLTGVGAQLELALVNLAMAKATEHGLTQMVAPALVKPEAMEGTGFLGAHAAEVYRVDADDLYLVGTSEVALAAYHTDEILDLSAGPKRYAGSRRASGARPARTARTPAASSGCTGSTRSRCSPSAARRRPRPSTCGCSAGRRSSSPRSNCRSRWSTSRPATSAPAPPASTTARPGSRPSDRYRELTSTSNCTTFQARRLNVRYRDENGKPQVAATLNGTLCAVTRTIACLLEAHQRPDGSVRVPAALRPWLGGREVLEPAG